MRNPKRDHMFKLNVHALLPLAGGTNTFSHLNKTTHLNLKPKAFLVQLVGLVVLPIDSMNMIVTRG